MVRDRVADVRQAGFSLTELIVVVAMIGILAALGMPMMISYWQTSTTTAGASELATALNRARQLAIAQNTLYCVEVSGTGVRYRYGAAVAACAGGGTVWTGTSSDGAGLITLSNNLTVTGGSVVFTPLGAASTAGTFTVTNPNGGSRNVVTAASGRVSVQ